MTKSEFINKVAANGEYTKKASKEMVDVVFESIVEAVAEDGKLCVPGFGNFVLVETTEREGRNPQTGEPMTIAPKKRISFKCSSSVKAVLNK